ncbi:MAG: hypothetical protein JNL26_19580 [Gemmatimonadetes bacterium]|nr:hypothetical protein [Gemmatimonadota bacterium]
MSPRRCTSIVVAVILAAASRLGAQELNARLPGPTTMAQLSGPRFGATFVPQRARAELASKGIEVGGVMSQFGWQFERLFLSGDGQMAAVSEFVLLVGGLDQGTFLPSLNWVIGARHIGGVEFGVGPNLSAAGSALVIAAGVTRRSGSMNFPVNVSVVPSKFGTRVSVLTGFTVR